MNKFLFVLATTLVLSTVSLVFAISGGNQQQDVIGKISDVFKSGNAQELSAYFNKTIEIEIDGEENFYSKAQAELLMKDFFNKNKPTKFQVNHKGAKDSNGFAIGTLTTDSKIFRVSIFLKADGNTSLIHQLRIETLSE